MSAPVIPDIPLVPERFAERLSATQTSVAEIKEDVHEFGRRVDGLEAEMRRGFSSVSTELNKFAMEVRSDSARQQQEAIKAAAPKGVQWPMVAVLVTVTALFAGWTSSYFGKDIAALARENVSTSERLSVLSNRLNEQVEKRARQEGAAERDAAHMERDNDRIQAEIDRLRGLAKTP